MGVFEVCVSVEGERKRWRRIIGKEKKGRERERRIIKHRIDLSSNAITI